MPCRIYKLDFQEKNLNSGSNHGPVSNISLENLIRKYFYLNKYLFYLISKYILTYVYLADKSKNRIFFIEKRVFIQASFIPAIHRYLVLVDSPPNGIGLRALDDHPSIRIN